MSNLLQRIIMFVFFIPAIFALIVFFPQNKHLILQCATLFVATLLAGEVARMYGILPPLKAKQEKLSLGRRRRFFGFVAVLACVWLPLMARMAVSYQLIGNWATNLSFIIPILWIFASQVVMSQVRPIDRFLPTTHGYLMILIYPGLGLSFFLAIIALPQATVLLLIFLGSVFMNDTIAYLAGRFLGKGSSHPMRISPNKTLVGFIFGFAASVGVLFLGYAYAPVLFPAGAGVVLVIGLLMGSATILGDLFESGLKRSFGTKDSGTVIMGRGGMLDSLDSLLFAAPVFYYSYTLLNSFPG